MAIGDRSVHSRRLCHSFEQSDGLALGPPASDSLPDWQRGQRVGESVGRLHGTPVGLGGRHWEDLQVLREGNYRGNNNLLRLKRIYNEYNDRKCAFASLIV